MTVLSTVAASIGPGFIVAIDGVDGAGKTVFADRLAELIPAAIRSSVDGFHRPRALRYRQGRYSPEGFLDDSYDYDALRTRLLQPFRAGQTCETAMFDHVTDAPVSVRAAVTPASVLVLDGIFLHRDELRAYWDYSVFLRVGFAETYARMATRDGCPPDPAHPANRRYVEGQREYLRRYDPEAHASVVIDNTEPASSWVVTPGR
jgi:uridine kinase